MSTGIKRPYEVMHKLAHELAAELSGSCQRIEVAGSVRRKKEMCGDLELVCIADGDKLNNQLNGWLASGRIRHVEAGPKKTKRWGDKQKSFNIEIGDGPVQVDVFIQTVERFAYTFLVRTGSGSFSNRMVTPVGVRTHDGLPGLMPPRFKFTDCLLYDRGVLCDVRDETDIFNRFLMDFVAPELRTDDYGLTDAQKKAWKPTVAPTIDPVAIAQSTVFDIRHWQYVLLDLPAWQHEIELAAKSKDATKRQRGQQLADFLGGKTISRQVFLSVLHELNGSLMYKVNWDAMRERLSE